MFDLIPANWYSDVYLHLFMFISIFTLIHTYILNIDSNKNLNYINITGYALLFFLILYIGQRPISNYFGDTVNYAKGYEYYLQGGKIDGGSDYGFQVYMKAISNFADIHIFFTICAFLYIYPLYKISKELFNQYWFYSFLILVTSFSFWTYGVNGVRNGAATSLFLWGLCYRNNIKIMLLFFILSISFHKTVFLPILAFTLTYYYNNPRGYFKMWMLAIPLSLAAGSIWVNLFASLGFDDRLSGYLTTADQTSAFRWDFLFHSAFGVFAAWYYIYKKKFSDLYYFRLVNTYLICNGFWILVIKASYSNRFAYLSWFMMGLIIIYPLLKQNLFKNNHIMIGKIILAYFSFTYLMSYIYYY